MPPTVPSPEQVPSLPKLISALSQVAPIGDPQLQGPQVMPDDTPVYHGARDGTAAGQVVLTPSKSWQTVLEGPAGTHTFPAPQPPPILAVAQNVPLLPQVGVGMIGVPEGVQPDVEALNAEVATP